MPRQFFCAIFLLALLGEQRPDLAAAQPRFVSPGSCATSLCHGGAGELREQHQIWSRKDMHARAFATLTTARSEQIMRALGGGNAPQDTRCTTCHAPFHGLAAERLINPIKASVGVSCQNCHGAAEDWLLAHTRADYSHQDRIHAGMRELRDLYHRANACVSCHQNVGEDLLNAGHPELIFELDGQTLAEPRHWRERGHAYQPAQAWLIGQVVALREMTWKAATSPAITRRFRERCEALIWLLEPVGSLDPELPKLDGLTLDPAAAPAQIRKLDAFASELSRMEWSEALTRRLLKTYAGSSADFSAGQLAETRHARRAERLVLALDRLTSALDRDQEAKLDAELRKLFDLAQSVPGFDPVAFGTTLQSFAEKL